MRIAYVTLHWPRTKQSSTGQKIIRHMCNWRDAGHEVRFFSHTHELPETRDLVQGRNFFYKQFKGLPGRLRTEISRIRAAKNMIAAVRQYKPDMIYLRWGMYVHPIHKLCRIAPVAVEVNTNDVLEHKRLGHLFNLYNQFTRGLILSRAAGFVFVTGELAKLDVFSRFDKPGIVIGNGLNLETISPLPAPNNDPPHLIFIGTAGMYWHGVEKLVRLAGEWPDLVIDVIGYDRSDFKTDLPGNLRIHGYQSGQDLTDALAAADCAIGTMSYHTIGLKEASPFKTRQYLSLGIPTILPYKDTDLHDLDTEFILRIPSTENNIRDFSEPIHNFIYSMRGKRIPRDLVADRIDSGKKESDRLAFLEKLTRQ